MEGHRTGVSCTEVFPVHTSSFKNAVVVISLLRRELILPDLQERVRDFLYQLKLRVWHVLSEYVTMIWQLISHVEDMSELDKITFITRGLVAQTRGEVVYLRFSTVHQALNVDMECEHVRPTQLHGYRGFSRSALLRNRGAEPRGFHYFGGNSTALTHGNLNPNSWSLGSAGWFIEWLSTGGTCVFL